MFTMENTEGFSKAELDTLNHALQMMLSRYPSADESNLSDLISNAWLMEPAADTIEKLFRRADRAMRA